MDAQEEISTQKKSPTPRKRTTIRKRIVRKPQVKKAVVKEPLESESLPVSSAQVPDNHAQIEDKVTTIIVLTVTVFFLLFVGAQILLQYRAGDGGLIDKDQTSNRSGLPFIQSGSQYTCAQHDNDPEACVKAQTQDKGCSWYSDCRKCIVGSHDGKTYEELCGRAR